MQPPRIPVLSAVEGRFTPVALKERHDGWTPARQFRFIEELAATRSVTKACRAVGMSRDSAYKLREKDCRGQSGHATRDRPANGFALAWKQALKPDPAAERSWSPRALQRLKRLEQRRKADKTHETHDPPISPARGMSALSPSSTLIALLERFRTQDLQPPFDAA